MGIKNYVYFDPQVIHVTLYEGNKINLPMYQKHIKLFRGLTNKVTIEIRDSDRKPVRVLNHNIQVFVTSPSNTDLMISKEASIVDERKGLYEFVLFPGEVQNWPAGFYTYSVILQDEDGTETPLFVDLAQNATGTFELIDKPLPAFQPSTLISPEDFLFINGAYISGRFPGDAQKHYKDSLHSFSVNLTDFTGKLWVQGSLEEYPTQDGEYFDIHIGNLAPEVDYVNFTGIDLFSFTGNYVWIRFKYLPDISNTGTFDKIWYKN